MFTKIIKTEWRNLFAEKSFLILAMAFSALLIYGIFNAANWVKERSAQSRILLEKHEKNLAEKQEKVRQGVKGSNAPGNSTPDPGDPYEMGMNLHYAVMPFLSSSVFAVGQSDVLSNNAGIALTTLQRTEADKDGFENPLSFLAGRFDLSFVIVYLLPLFVLAMSFNLLSAERENGTLQLLLANPLKLQTLLNAKLTANFLIIFGVITVVTIIGLLLTADFAKGDFVPRFLLWILLVVAYVLFWFSLAVFVNSYGFSSATNAVISAAAWLILVLILPTLLNVAISAAYPVPPRNEVVSAIRNINLDMRRDGEKLLTEFYQDHPELIPKDGKTDTKDFGLAFVYVQREHKKKVAEVENRFDEQLGNQQNLVQNLRFLSPSIITQEAVNDIAGTGLERYTNFRRQTKEFDKTWDEYFSTKIFRNEMLTTEDFDKIPRFQFQEESFTSLFNRTIYGILFLLIMSVVLMYLAFGKLKNYRLER
jgi:ABC-2 type transport system permease protein